MDDSTYIDLDELFTKKETLQGGNHIFDPNEWLQLIDNFIMLGETEADDFVIDPAIELCEALIARGSRESHAHLRLARCHFLRGRYSAARSHVSECLASPSCDDAVREEAAAFTEELTTRVSADGKVGLVAIAAIVLGGVFWYLSYRNRTDGSSTGDFGDDAGRNAGQREGHDGMA